MLIILVNLISVSLLCVTLWNSFNLQKFIFDNVQWNEIELISNVLRFLREREMESRKKWTESGEKRKSLIIRKYSIELKL